MKLNGLLLSWMSYWVKFVQMYDIPLMSVQVPLKYGGAL